MIDEINTNLNIPPPEKKLYSKLGVLGLALAILSLFVVWTALLVIGLPLRVLSYFCPVRSVDAMYREYFDLIGIALRYFHSEKYYFTPGNGRPILCVHGYLHNASGWYAMIEQMKRKGMGPIYAIDLDGKFQPIHTYAAQVNAKVQDIFEKTGRRDIAIVGHSMGGLVSALASPKNVTDVITIGTPFHGSPVARCLAIGPNGREMVPGSPLLIEVQNQIHLNKDRIHYRHIGSKCDLLVSAKSALMGEENKDNVLFDDLGHVSLQVSEKVGNKVCGWLSRVNSQA